MNLHEDKDIFAVALQQASKSPEEGGLGIKSIFLEKDYWICRSLKQLSDSEVCDLAVFKGGTSLSKAHAIGSRFSEDIDIAITDDVARTDNQTKNLIHKISSAMSAGLNEITKPDTRKYSKYRKTYYGYPQTVKDGLSSAVNSGQILLEIVSFANPYPYHKKKIKSFLAEYLEKTGNAAVLKQFGMDEFEVNVLDSSRTATEKLVSLFRHSLTDDWITEVKAKIRHFYDLHFLLKDDVCRAYLSSEAFRIEFDQLFKSDQERFKEPTGWQEKTLMDSPLITDFDKAWIELKGTYAAELPELAYQSIPAPEKIASSFMELISLFKR